MADIPKPSAERLSELFVTLARIPSPSRSERAVADAVTSLLTPLGLEVAEDEVGAAIGGDCGNLVCKVGQVNTPPCVALGAHLDTVPPTSEIDPVLQDDGCFNNACGGILGADDKAAIAALLHATELMVGQGGEFAPFELFFTVCEEDGLMGAKNLSDKALQSPVAIVLDSAGPVGGVVLGAPSQKILRARFRGTAAHAGIEPEVGRNAVEAAAKAVARMDLGRLDSETTANIGVINGGVATNVVPDLCEVSGECRSHDENRLAQVAASMMDAIHLAATEVGVDVDVELTEEFHSFRLEPESPVVEMAKSAIVALGLEPRLHVAGGGSDANVLNGIGVPTVNLTSGMMRVHSADEYVPLQELVGLCELTLHLIAEAGATRGEGTEGAS